MYASNSIMDIVLVFEIATLPMAYQLMTNEQYENS